MDIFYALRVLQHRGQESAGIAVYSNGIKSLKGMGLAHQALKADEIRNLARKSGMAFLRENALSVVLAGITTPEEMLGITIGAE